MPSRFQIHDLAKAEGVERPFDILVRMPAESRLMIGRLLRCNIRGDECAEEQAWRIIHQNLRGLQARTHSLPAQLTPFSRNNNWWEIVTRAARRCGLRFYPGVEEAQVERLLFEHFAARFVKERLVSGDDPADVLSSLDYNFERAIASLGLSHDGKRALVAALLSAADGAGDPREGANRLSDWLRRAMPWSWTTSITTGLRLLQQRLGDVYEQWMRAGLRRPTNIGKVCAVLAMIYVHDLVERTCEQFDLVGG